MSTTTDEQIKQAESDFTDAGDLNTLAKQLQAVSQEIDLHDPKDLTGPDDDGPTIDCRLRYHERRFSLATGDQSYDPDLRGHWGASSVGPKLSFDEAKSIGADLLDQVLNSIAESE